MAVFFAIALAATLWGFVSWFAVCAYRRYSQARQVICPLSRSGAVVRVHAGLATRTHFTGYPDLRLKSCSRWPDRACGHECLPQVRSTCAPPGSGSLVGGEGIEPPTTCV
jgi:hypothetical protein